MELNRESIEGTLKDWTTMVEREIKELLDRSGVRATGRLIESVAFATEETEQGITLGLKLTEYGIYVLKGRGPGKQPPLKSIQEWVALKGLPKEAAYPIARSIGLKGIKPFNFVAPFYKHITDLKDRIGRDYAEQLKDDTLLLLKNVRLK